MVKSIMVASNPGGVGKTVIALNLAIALSKMGYKVLLSDGDQFTGTAAIYLGIKDKRMEVFENMSIREAIKLIKQEGIIKSRIIKYKHASLDMLLTEPRTKQYNISPKFMVKLVKLIYNLKEFQEILRTYDFIITDTPAQTLTPKYLAELFYSTMVVVSTPTYPAIMASKELLQRVSKFKIKTVFIINRYEEKDKYALKLNAIKKMAGVKSFYVLPEEKTMPKALEKHLPMYILNQNSKFSRAMKDFASELSKVPNSLPPPKKI